MASSSSQQGSRRPVGAALDRTQSRRLQALHAEFARAVDAGLGRVLPTPSASLISLEETVPEARREGGPRYPLDFSALEPHAGVLECSEELAALVLDHLLVYDGAPARAGAGLSEIEQQLLFGALEPLLTGYAEMWKPHAAFQARRESAPEPLRPGEPLYVAAYRVRTPTGSGELALVLRLSAWQGALASTRSREGRPAAAQAPSAGLLDAIGDCVLPARVLFGRARLTVGELLDLREGDVVLVDRDERAPLEICLGDRPKLQGHVYEQDGRFVVTVVGPTPGRAS